MSNEGTVKRTAKNVGKVAMFPLLFGAVAVGITYDIAKEHLDNFNDEMDRHK